MRGIRAGSELELDDGTYRVAEVAGGLLKLRRTDDGTYTTAHISEVAIRVKTPPERESINARITDIVSDSSRANAELWASHIAEMLHGDPLPGGTARKRYDPSLSTLSERVTRKSKELEELGSPVSTRSLWRKKNLYLKGGAAALTDGRAAKNEFPMDRTDSRVIEALNRVIAAETKESSGTETRLHRRLKEELLRAHPGEVIAIPSKATLYRHVDFLTKGKHTTGSAPTRRSAAKTPNRPFGSVRRMRPGQEVQIDVSPWDLLVVDGEGEIQPAKLTIMLDIATRSIISSGVRLRGTKGADHAVLLAGALVPRSLRPGHVEHWDLISRRQPWADLVPETDRAKFDLRRPFIVPERIMTDNGADFRSTTFESACLKFGIDLTYAAPGTPTDKPHVERTFSTIKTLFAQNLPGFKGESVARRGEHPEQDDLLDVFTLAEMFEEWVSRVYQNSPTGGLFDPFYPGISLSPNDMYNASFDVTGFLPIPLTRDDYIELMPVEHRTIQSDGIQFNLRNYDSPELQPFRGKPSPHPNKGNQWLFRYHPYDIRVIWLQHPIEGHWIECVWRSEGTYEGPFAPRILREARRVVEERGHASRDELDELAAAVISRGTAKSAEIRRARARDEAAKELASQAGTGFPAFLAASSEIPVPQVASNSLVEEFPPINLESFDAEEETTTW